MRVSLLFVVLVAFFVCGALSAKDQRLATCLRDCKQQGFDIVTCSSRCSPRTLSDDPVEDCLQQCRKTVKNPYDRQSFNYCRSKCSTVSLSDAFESDKNVCLQQCRKTVNPYDRESYKMCLTRCAYLSA
ncbi:hypothetical protein AKO1_003808 [Acrasis kona]|uniref:Uncharacterized protein n=1 Tax=Acrasis kona TaxID=1008807 RepID=A0AAW2Z790_9EUKA